MKLSIHLTVGLRGIKEWKRDLRLLPPEVAENCALLGYYAVGGGDFLPTFRDNLSVPSSGVKNSLKMGRIVCPETSVRNYHYSLLNNPGCLTLEDGIDRVSRNVSNKLPLLAA